MHIRSLGLGTDLELAKTRGQVIDRDGYLVVRTPDDPTYYFGNLLVLPAAPQVGEVAYWTRKFASELGGDPAIRHVALRWDGIHGDTGATDELKAAGFTVEVLQVMTAAGLELAPCSHDIVPLEARHLVEAAELEYAIGDRHDDSFRQFLHRRAAWKQTLLATGRATFWGAFDQQILVGSLGLVPLGTRARYQDVQTAIAYRGQGIARGMLRVAAQAARASELVIVAEPGSQASRVYEQIGFRTVELVGSACRYPVASE
jgi:ribosomal protein S18 acetylase RimI-like enzyme